MSISISFGPETCSHVAISSMLGPKICTRTLSKPLRFPQCVGSTASATTPSVQLPCSTLSGIFSSNFALRRKDSGLEDHVHQYRPRNRAQTRRVAVALRESLAEGESWATLQKWARAQGMTWGGWQVGEIDGIRGAVATKRIRAVSFRLLSSRSSHALPFQSHCPDHPSALPPPLCTPRLAPPLALHRLARLALIAEHAKF